MWLTDNSINPPNKIISFSASGGHMSWISTCVGFLLNKWPIENGAFSDDGAAHGYKHFLPHYGRRFKAFNKKEFTTAKEYSAYLDEFLGYNGLPTIYHDGPSSVQHADYWLNMIGEFGYYRPDTLFIPTMPSDMREAVYMFLNAAKKLPTGQEALLFTFTNIEQYPTDESEENYLTRLSLSFIPCLVKHTGLTQIQHAKFRVSPADIVNSDHQFYDTLISNIARIYNLNITQDQIRYMHKKAEIFGSLNTDMWDLSYKIVFGNVDDWPTPQNYMQRLLYRTFMSRRFNKLIPDNIDWSAGMKYVISTMYDNPNINLNDYYFPEAKWFELQ